jgi:hypothetical protein
MNKKCIWCLKTDLETSFNKLAHIFPKSIGGMLSTPHVCDNCNHYFGAKQNPSKPSVEIALKEPLNISRYYVLSQFRKGKVGLPRFKSEYFSYNLTKQHVDTLYKYRLISDFQKRFIRQLKRGLYKVFLETRSITHADALDSKYDFIRHFARYDLGELPVYYFTPKLKAIFVSEPDALHPQIRFTESIEGEMSEFGFYGYYFITHYLAFPVISNYLITLENYMKYTLQSKDRIFEKAIEIKSLSDLDFTYRYMA